MSFGKIECSDWRLKGNKWIPSFLCRGSAERHACDEHACLTELIIDLHNDLLRDLNHHFNLIQDEIREQNEKV